MPANPFDQFDAPLSTPQPIIPRTPAPQTQPQYEGDVLSNDYKREQIKTEQLKQAQTQQEIDQKNPQKKAQQNARQLLTAAGVDLEKGIDPVGDLIKGSTSGMIQHGAASAYGAVTGHSTSGMENIGRLKTIASTLTLQLMNGSLGTGISNADRDFISEQIGNIGNPDVPAEQRLAAWDQVKQRMANLSGIPYAASVKEFGGDNHAPPGNSELTADQEKAYRAFLTANPNPTGSQVNTFLSGLTGKQVTNGEDIAKAISEGRGISTTTQDLTEQQKVQQRIQQEDKSGAFQEGDTHRLLMHGATLNLSDEASGVGEAAANVLTSPFTGNFDPVGSYRLGRDVERQRISDAEGRLGYGGTALEFAGNLLSANPEAAAGKVYGLGSLVRQGAKAGGAAGAIAGYGQGEGTNQSLVGAGVGGLTGAAVGAAGGRFLGPKAVPPGGGEGPGAAEIATALQDEGIRAARPVADPSKRGSMAYLETTRGGHGPVRDSLELTRQDIASKVAGLSGDGEALTPGGMGESIQEAGKRSIQSIKDSATRFYDRAASAGADTPIQPTEALANLDAHIADLSRNPNTNKGVLSYLKSVRGDLASGNKTVADIRNIRTGMSGEINRRNLGQSNAERIMGDVMDSARADIERDLGRANPEALSLYQQGDDLWRQMSTERQQVLEKLVGPADNPISGEQAMARVRNMMGNKGDLGRFNRIMNMLNPEEQANFRASLFDGIGQKSPEEPFSPAYFLQQTKDMQPGALKTVFGDDGAKSIQNLRVASRGFTDAQASLNNSRSGFVNNFKDIVSSIVNLRSATGAGAGYMIGGPPGAVAGAIVGETAKLATNRLSAKALMNPEVSSWIRKVAVAKTDQQARALIGKLNGLAAGNAGLQGELGSLRDAIVRAVNDNAPRAGSVAASPDQRPDQQQ